MVKMFGERVEKQMEKAGTGYLAGNKVTLVVLVNNRRSIHEKSFCCCIPSCFLV